MPYIPARITTSLVHQSSCRPHFLAVPIRSCRHSYSLLPPPLPHCRLPAGSLPHKLRPYKLRPAFPPSVFICIAYVYTPQLCMYLLQTIPTYRRTYLESRSLPLPLPLPPLITLVYRTWSRAPTLLQKTVSDHVVVVCIRNPILLCLVPLSHIGVRSVFLLSRRDDLEHTEGEEEDVLRPPVVLMLPQQQHGKDPQVFQQRGN
ncbi:hypothetical protein C8T65DRAFT_195537 [Cerioporus squamosus]|nr:hypothetical protein C8T65DRAFT_195537 [Cerioporus squamosus]